MLLSVAAWASAAAGPVTDILAFPGNTGAYGPGLGQNVWFKSFEGQPTTNERGDAVFAAALAGPEVTAATEPGIFVSPLGAPTRTFVRAGDVAPGTGGARFIQFLRFGIDNDGNVVFIARLDTGDGQAAYGVWCGSGTHGWPTQLLLRGGDPFPLPGSPGSTLYAVNEAVLGLSAGGKVLVKVKITTDTFGPIVDAIFAGPTTGPLAPVVSGRMDVPGMPAGTRMTAIGTPWINKHGDVVFPATRSGPGANNFEGLFLSRNGQVSVIASENALDGLRGFDQPAIADDGTIAAFARYGPASGTGSRLPWIRSSSGQVTFPMQGVPPECPPGVSYGRPLGITRISNNGRALLCCELTGGYGHFVFPPGGVGTPQRASRTGEQLPGMPLGTSFVYYGLSVMDGIGRELFIGHMRSSPDAPWVSSFWMWDPQTGLQMPVPVGSPILCGDGVMRPAAGAGGFLSDVRTDQLTSLATDGYLVATIGFDQPPPNPPLRGLFRVHLPHRCGPADLAGRGGAVGHDGLLDNNDFVVFIDRFFAADARADLGVAGGLPGRDGTFDNNDFVAFIDWFFAGCP
ncbi:MAG TPA: GC-type dockerin domain-anchored protein [Phycisphaerales bacterium]|nr:GC-type dockerin domain-anchored protein [Phycisphaerales bacterium]